MSVVPAAVTVVGAGGLGSYIGAVLARAGHEVTLLARGDHAEAVRSLGLRVRTEEGPFVVHPSCPAPNRLPDAVDLVLVAVKAYSLDEVAPLVSTLAERGGTVLPLLNGVDAAERLAALGVPPEALVDGMAYVTAFRTSPGVVERKGSHQRLVIGCPAGRGADRVEAVRRIFADTPIDVSVAEDIRVELWMKMAVVCSLSVICGLTGAAVGPIRRHRFGGTLQSSAIAEVLAVGRSLGVPLAEDAEDTVGRILDGFGDDFYPSVLHDLRSGRPTEMDRLAGTVARLADERGVAAPLAAAATCAVSLIEARGGAATPDRS